MHSDGGPFLLCGGDVDQRRYVTAYALVFGILHKADDLEDLWIFARSSDDSEPAADGVRAIKEFLAELLGD